MLRFRVPRTQHLATIVALSAGLCIASIPAKTQSQTDDKTLAQAPAQLKIESNLVVVRVVVRDAQGHPVEGLKKEDFKLFDRGKEQAIAQFEDEPQSDAPSNLPTAQPEGKTAAPLSATAQERFIAFYFDDLNTSDGDMIQARDAADAYLAASLHPQDRVAIFTTGRVLTDFTSDPKQIREALFKLHSSSRMLSRTHDCPDLSDYQAQEMERTEDMHSSVWLVAMAEAKSCAPPPDPRSTPLGIRTVVERILGQVQEQARENVQQFAQVVKYVAQVPGLRTVVLVSPGFLSESEQLGIDRTIDRALRSQVVINSLNPKGLAVMMRESDASRSSISISDPHATGARNVLDASRDFVANDVLAEMAHGTGGEFIHDDNDLKAGFEALAGHPTTYILAFAPREVKLDGKFHELKVTLAEKRKGYAISARRGYFALADQGAATVEATQPKSQPEAVAEAAQPKAPNPTPTAEVKQPVASNPEAQEQQQIQDALRSKTDSAELPVGMDASPSEGTGETRALALTIHLDTKPLPLRKDGGHRLNALTFSVAVFDEKDNVVEVKQRHAKVNLLDDQLPDFLADGVDVNMMFELKPGMYRLRVAVIESEQHRLGAFSRAVAVP